MKSRLRFHPPSNVTANPQFSSLCLLPGAPFLRQVGRFYGPLLPRTSQTSLLSDRHFTRLQGSNLLSKLHSVRRGLLLQVAK